MRMSFTKVAAAAAVLAGVSTSALAIPYVTLVLSDVDVTTSTLVTKSCSTDTAANVALCAASGFLTGGVGSTLISFGTILAPLGGGFASSGVIGSYTITSTSAESNAPGTPQEAFLNRSQTSALRNNPGNADVHYLQVDFQSYGFTDPNGEFKTLSASAGMTANAGSYSASDKMTSFFSVDKANGLAATASVACALMKAGPGVALDESCNLGPVQWQDTFSPASLFSMRSIQRFEVAIGSRINSTANSVVVPEPMSTALVGIGLFGLAVASRRRASKKA